MSIFEKLLKNDFLKIENILLTFHKKIGLTLEQTFLFIKVMNYQKVNLVFEIEIFTNQNSEQFSKSFIEETISLLYSRKFIEVTTKSGKMIFLFETFWKKVEIWFDNFPFEKSNDDKVEWLLFNMSLSDDFSLKTLKIYFEKNQKHFEKYIILQKENNIIFTEVVKYIENQENKIKEQPKFKKEKLDSKKEKTFSESDNKPKKVKPLKTTPKEVDDKLSQKNWFE